MKYTWLEKISKLFSLVKLDKKNYFLHFLQSIIRWLNPIMHVVFIEKITYALTSKDYIFLEKILLYYIIAIFLYELLWFFSRKVWWIITIPNAESNIYDMYLKRFIRMNNNEVEKIWIWKIIAILENWRLRWWESIAAVVEKWTALLILLFYVWFVTIKHWFLFTLWFFLLLVISIIVLFFVNKYQFRYRNKRSELRNNRLRSITKVLMSKNEILQTNNIKTEILKIKDFCDETSKVNIEMSNWRTIQNRFIPFMIWLSIFLFVFIYSKIVLNWYMTLSQFVWITSIFLIVNSSILNFTAFYIDLTKDFIDIEKMWDFFENTPEIEWYETWKDFIYKKWDIEVRDLNFSYYEWKYIFENFSHKFDGWKITALVWNSWSWKSTLVKLIAWYIRQNSWKIFVDWQDLGETSLKSYYKNIWYLTQEPSVFDGSVLENLTYSVDNVETRHCLVSTNDEIWEKISQAIKDSNCEFIYDLPNWLETQIWERWVKLSGWQKQRLAIAKIMLKNPSIIILDEPTSALDSFSEEQITKAMHNLFEWRTVIIIAHRLQTVKHADKIIVFEEGNIVESWNHLSLIKEKWIYKKMLDLQSGF